MTRTILLATLLAAGCASESTNAPPPEALTFEVLYVGSDGPIAAHGADRIAALPEALAASPADVLCLQGIGADADRASLRAAVARTYPWSLDLATADDDVAVDALPPLVATPPCANLDDAVVRSLRCVGACVDRERQRLLEASCIPSDADGCFDATTFAGDPDRRCRSCLSDHLLTGASPDDARERCTTLAHPLVAHGAHGMLLLSRLPLGRPSIVVLPAEGARRAILGATATTPRGQALDVVCATLGPTAESGLPLDPRTVEPYPGPYGGPTDGWLRENDLHVERLIAHVEARREGRPAIVLGNFGASEATTRAGGVQLPAEGAAAARRLGEAFASGIAPDYVPSCTICPENPLVTADAVPSFSNRIYLAGLPATAARASTRTYLGELVLGEPIGGVRPRLPLAVQYGFRSTIEVSP